jgi:YggT family protein
VIIRPLLNLFLILLVVDAVLSYIPQVRQQVWAQKLKQGADFVLNPIRKFLPKDWPVDVSPLIVIIIVKLFELLW